MFVKIFDNYHAGVSLMSEAEQDAFYGAVMRYAFEGREPEFDGIAAAVWATIKDFIDKSLQGQSDGSKGGNGRGNRNPEKPQRKTDTENPPEKGGCKTPPENQKKRIEGIGKEKLEVFFSNSSGCGADAGEPAPQPLCPMCSSPVERTGMADPDYWWCASCKDSFPSAKVGVP